MAGTMVPKIFGKKGADVPGLTLVEINFDNSKGEFAHEPNPLVASNLRQLQGAVVSEKADLGICFDGTPTGWWWSMRRATRSGATT